MTQATAIHFKRPTGVYTPGDVAVFPATQAQGYIKAGLAELHTEQPAAAPPTAPRRGRPPGGRTATSASSGAANSTAATGADGADSAEAPAPQPSAADQDPDREADPEAADADPFGIAGATHPDAA